MEIGTSAHRRHRVKRNREAFRVNYQRGRVLTALKRGRARTLVEAIGVIYYYFYIIYATLNLLNELTHLWEMLREALPFLESCFYRILYTGVRMVKATL